MEKNGGGIDQWLCTCLACVSPCVQSPKANKKKWNSFQKEQTYFSLFLQLSAMNKFKHYIQYNFKTLKGDKNKKDQQEPQDSRTLWRSPWVSLLPSYIPNLWLEMPNLEIQQD